MKKTDSNFVEYDTKACHYDLNITDQRDIDEINRRKKLNKGCTPPRDELYSCNPNFDGNYTIGCHYESE